MTDETTNPEAQAEDVDTEDVSTKNVSAKNVSAKASEAVSEVREKAAAAAQKTRRKTTATAKKTVRSTKKQADKVADDVKDNAKDEARDLGNKVREQAQGARERVQAEAEREFQKGKSHVVSQVHGVAEAFRKTGEQLREEDQGDLAGYTDRIADNVDKVSSYLDDKGLRGAVSDLEGFARQRPGLFVGGALAVGLVAARFLRSSGTRR